MFSIISAWALFGGIHSLTATDALKSRLASIQYLRGRYYRLWYNAVAVLTLLMAVAVTRTHLVEEFIHWRGVWRIVPVLGVVSAITIFAISGRGYDLRAFAGLRANRADDFGLTFVHRYVRHPWYFALLLLLWIRDLSVGWLVANVCITIYLMIGIVCEERRLRSRFGDAFAQYQQKVPALFPWPGKYLTEIERGRIQRDSAVDAS